MTGASRGRIKASTMSITKEQVLEALSHVDDPDLKKDLVTLGMIEDVTIEENSISFTVVLTTPACPATGVDAFASLESRHIFGRNGGELTPEPVHGVSEQRRGAGQHPARAAARSSSPHRSAIDGGGFFIYVVTVLLLLSRPEGLLARSRRA